MATTFGQAFIFAIQFCHDYSIQMTDQQMHDFCNLLIEFRDGSRPTPRAVDGGQDGENNGQVALPTATNA